MLSPLESAQSVLGFSKTASQGQLLNMLTSFHCSHANFEEEKIIKRDHTARLCFLLLTCHSYDIQRLHSSRENFERTGTRPSSHLHHYKCCTLVTSVAHCQLTSIFTARFQNILREDHHCKRYTSTDIFFIECVFGQVNSGET